MAHWHKMVFPYFVAINLPPDFHPSKRLLFILENLRNSRIGPSAFTLKAFKSYPFIDKGLHNVQKYMDVVSRQKFHFALPGS
jgi:hypothetical protein